MNRRDFINKTTLIGTSASLFGGISQFALAQKSHQIQSIKQTGPLIIVFLRGGADGLGILSPLEDSNFISARSPQLLFAPTENPIFIAGTKLFWHPQASAFSELMLSGRLVPWLATGIINETRSHFEAQEIIERGVSELHTLPNSMGLITKIAAGIMSPDSFLFAGGSNLPRAMQGNLSAIAIRDLQNGIQFPGGVKNLAVLAQLANVDRAHPASEPIQKTLALLFNIQKYLDPSIKLDFNKIKPYESQGRTPYTNSDPSVGLRSIARLLNSNVPLQYAWVDHGGWDMHEGQPNRMNNTLNQLSQALKAFDEDLQAQQKKYTLVVLTEFGRRFRSNGSNGTDHGHGGLSLVIGSNLPKNKVMGYWPGIAEKDLNRGVDLAVTTPYQDVLNQAMQWGHIEI
ncbi:MAG: DUF1501 domain-containing protein [Betaproteobacteria bacterium]|nr:DUF1501 domain-containing protein [Betaproteobacteria bacterium]